ncbi:MAG: Asp-tRNA(Asn)/Glu-tRNA(Gln) amidotransferase subunit GatC [Gammaproteobacteria bacterium]|nr:Asp-tRNA(Asn)/Glu-tRNA(Gln) amidotransferase subunit GatC [Gammaproteobacteria bacterium]
MSTLTRENIEKVAHLARLAISEEEILTHVRNLSNILELVEQMNSVDTQGITPMAHPLDIPQPLRIDRVTEKNERALLQSVAEPSAIKSGLYIVPKAYDTVKEFETIEE